MTTTEAQMDYAIHLQRIIESICHGRPLREDGKVGAPHHHAMAAAYLASAPSSREAPKVKALEWRKGAASITHIADHPLGRYIIEEGDAECRLYREGYHRLAGHYGSLFEAKAAAQSDYEARILSALASPVERPGEALADVAAERERQKAVEGWTPEHDDAHVNGEMAAAAICYAFTGVRSHHHLFNQVWPRSWGSEWWKPTTVRRNYVKAAALLIAEIERHDRINARLAAPTPSNTDADSAAGDIGAEERP